MSETPQTDKAAYGFDDVDILVRDHTRFCNLLNLSRSLEIRLNELQERYDWLSDNSEFIEQPRPFIKNHE